MPGAVTEVVSPYQFKPGPYSSHTSVLKQFPAAGEGRTVLDVGCASGYLARDLAARGYRVTGIDLEAAPGLPEIEFIAADLDRGLPRLERRFDFILCADVLEHLRDPRQLLLYIRSHLAPGGRLILSLPNSGHAYFRANILLGRFPQHDRGLFDRTHVRFFMWKNWVELLEGAGFDIENVRVTGVPVGLAAPRWDGSLMVRLLERLAFDLARIWKSMFAYQFVVRVRPRSD